MSAGNRQTARRDAAPGSGRLIAGLAAGDREVLDWLKHRARYRASPRFSGWAWAFIEDDFVADLTVQLTVSMTREGFELRGRPVDYVDASISNLCKSYFRRIARLRNDEPLDEHASELPSSEPSSLARVSAGLELRRVLRTVSAACRGLLVGKYVEGLSLAELADSLGIEPKTVQSRLHGCRERLRRAFDQRSTGSTTNKIRSVGSLDMSPPDRGAPP